MARTRITYSTLLQRARDDGFDLVDAKATRVFGQCLNAALRFLATVADWRFLDRRHQFLTVAPYETGTVAVTQGGVSVALAGSAAWTTKYGQILSALVTTNTKRYNIQIAGAFPDLRILSCAAAALVLEADQKWHGSTQTAGTYKIVKERYDLLPDIKEVLFLGQADQTNPMTGLEDEEELRLLKAGSMTPSRPTHYLLEEEKDDEVIVSLWPPPDDIYPVMAILRMWPALLEAGGTSEYPNYLEPLVFLAMDWAIAQHRRDGTTMREVEQAIAKRLPTYVGSFSKYSGKRVAGTSMRNWLSLPLHETGLLGADE